MGDQTQNPEEIAACTGATHEECHRLMATCQGLDGPDSKRSSNVTRKLTASVRRLRKEIVRMHLFGYSRTFISSELGVTRGTVDLAIRKWDEKWGQA